MDKAPTTGTALPVRIVLRVLEGRPLPADIIFGSTCKVGGTFPYDDLYMDHSCPPVTSDEYLRRNDNIRRTC